MVDNWRSRAVPIGQPGPLPFKNNPYVDSVGAVDMTEEDILRAIDPGALPADDWRSRAQPIGETAKAYGPPNPKPQLPPAAPAPAPQKEGLGGTVFDQGMQGATFGFADDIADRLGVAGSVLMTDPIGFLKGEVRDPALAQEIVGARKGTQDRLQRQMEQRPKTAIASNIAGGLVTGVAGASTGAGTAAGNFIRAGNLPARMAKGAAAGAASGGLYGLGAGEDGAKIDSGKRGAVLGGSVGVAAPVIGSALSSAVKGAGNVARGAMARGEDALDHAAQKIAENSRKSYSRMRQIGATFTPNANQRIAQKIEQSLLSDGPLNSSLHDKVLAAMGDIKKGGFGTLEELDQWRQVLNDVAGNFSDKVNARKARIMIDAIDEAIDGISPGDLANGSREAVEALMQGRKEWGRKVRFETVANIVKNAAGDANKLKRDLEKLRLSNKTRGWSGAEKEALKFASKQTTGEGALKLLGKFGFDLGSGRAVGNTALPIMGGLTAGVGTGSLGPAAIVPIAGTAARAGHKAIAAGKAENLLKVIEGGGKVTMKQIMALPPKEAQQVLTLLRTMQIPNALVAQETIQ